VRERAPAFLLCARDADEAAAIAAAVGRRTRLAALRAVLSLSLSSQTHTNPEGAAATRSLFPSPLLT
jgi:hypothetical protein